MFAWISFHEFCRMSYLIDAYYNSGPDSEGRQAGVLQRFEDLAEFGDIDPRTFDVLRPAAKVVTVHELSGMTEVKDQIRHSNHYVLAQIMRLTCPKKGKVFKLQKVTEGEVETLSENAEAQSPLEVIDLGRYDCMVWFRYALPLTSSGMLYPQLNEIVQFLITIHYRCVLSNCVFALFKESAQETAELFMLKRQDWIGLYVVLLNPWYEGHVLKKDVMKVGLEEILLPITDPSWYAPGRIDEQLNPLMHAVKAGPMPLKIRTSRIEVQDLFPSLKTCGNPCCDGRHLEGSRCAIPPRGPTPVPIVGFSAVIMLPDFPELGPVHISSTAFSKLFCTEKFLNEPYRFLEFYKPAGDTVNHAFRFYEEKGYVFELGGLVFGRRVEEKMLAVRKVVVSYFKIIDHGWDTLHEKFGCSSLSS